MLWPTQTQAILLSATILPNALSLNSDVYTRQSSACSSASIPYPVVPGATITSLTATVHTTYCLVNVTLTHSGTGDSVTNQIALPLTGWNGRFQGTGGGGYTAGTFSSLPACAITGYACAATDAGHTMNDGNDASPWALLSQGNVNQYLLLDFAHLSYHDMTIVGKAITTSFYGHAPAYSYWNGCSTGGRQGLALAQRYPADYDGILADAPAVQWNDFTPAQQWPYVVMNNEGYAPLSCEFAVATAGAIAACDSLDQQVDGIIAAPALCQYNAHQLVGSTFNCTSGTTSILRTFSKKAADVIQMIWEGPATPQGHWLWFGPTRGTNLATLADTVVATGESSATAVPFGISDSWYRNYLYGSAAYNTANMSYAEFSDLFLAGHLEYDSTMGTFSPDLRAFKRLGHKLLTWQGLADNYIMPQGTQLYYSRILALDPTAHTFYRQFFSPGVAHCGGGTGVVPLNALGALAAWVENGTAPQTLMAGSQYPYGASSTYRTNGTNARFLDLCPWPQVNKYKGKGDPNAAASYTCAGGTGWVEFGGPVGGVNNSCVGGPGWYAGS